MICLCLVINNISTAANCDFEMIEKEEVAEYLNEENDFVCVQNNAFDRFDAKYPNSQKVVLEKGTTLICSVCLEKVFSFEQTQTDLFLVHNKSLGCLNAFKCEYGEFEIIKNQKIKYNGKNYEVNENIKVFIPKGKLTLVTPNILIACRSGIKNIHREKNDESECSFNTTVFKANLILFELKPKTEKLKPEIFVKEGSFDFRKELFERSL